MKFLTVQSLHFPVTSSLLGTLFSHTVNLCSSISVKQHVSQPYKSYVNVKLKLEQSQYRPEQTLRVPRGLDSRFQDNRHMDVVILSALRTGRLYPPGDIPGTHFCQGLSRPHDHSATGRIIRGLII